MAPKRATKLHFYCYSRNLVAILVVRRDFCPPHFPGVQEDIKQQCLIWHRPMTSFCGGVFWRYYPHWISWSAYLLRFLCCYFVIQSSSLCIYNVVLLPFKWPQDQWRPHLCSMQRASGNTLLNYLLAIWAKQYQHFKYSKSINKWNIW